MSASQVLNATTW